MSKYIQDRSNSKVWALMLDNRMAGKVLWVYGKTGSVECGILSYRENLLKVDWSSRGKVGSNNTEGGFCKTSEAFSRCLRANDIKNQIGGRGDGACRQYLEQLGFEVLEVL